MLVIFLSKNKPMDMAANKIFTNRIAANRLFDHMIGKQKSFIIWKSFIILEVNIAFHELFNSLFVGLFFLRIFFRWAIFQEIRKSGNFLIIFFSFICRKHRKFSILAHFYSFIHQNRFNFITLTVASKKTVECNQEIINPDYLR